MARPVIAAGVALAAISAVYVAEQFKINTDINKLISNDLPWRKREIAYQKLFPASKKLTAVIDAPTPELAGEAAYRLTKRLAQEKDVIKSVRQLTGGPFLAKNGLLFMPEGELQETLAQLTKSRALLEPLAADRACAASWGQ